MLFLGLCGGVGRYDRRRGDEWLVRENDEDDVLIPVRCIPLQVYPRRHLRRDHKSCRLHDMLKTNTLLRLSSFLTLPCIAEYP